MNLPRTPSTPPPPTPSPLLPPIPKPSPFLHLLLAGGVSISRLPMPPSLSSHRFSFRSGPDEGGQLYGLVTIRSLRSMALDRGQDLQTFNPASYGTRHAAQLWTSDLHARYEEGEDRGGAVILLYLHMRCWCGCTFRRLRQGAAAQRKFLFCDWSWQ